MTLKEQLHDHCLQFINERLSICNIQLEKIKEDLLSETKSTAGDKHETGRAMLQLEREKLGQQLAAIEITKATLFKIDVSKTSDTICLGSIVYTSQNNYFIGISAGELIVDGVTFYAISPSTPIGQLLLGKCIGDVVVFRGVDIGIEKII